MTRTATVAFLLLVLLAGCAGTERNGLKISHVEMPEWALTGKHPDYPESDYLVAFGLARTSKEATDIAEKRLEVKICDYAIRQRDTLFKDTEFNELVTEPAAWFKLGEFGNAVREDAASDGFQTVVARAINFNELKLRAASLLLQARKDFSQATAPPVGLGGIAKRMELWGGYYLKAVRVVALGLLAKGKLDQEAFSQVEHALSALRELPSLCQTDEIGGGQHVRIHGGLEKPLLLKVYFHGQPVKGVPISWGPARGFEAALEGDNELDDRGLASAKLLYFAATGDNFGYVQARLDLDRLIGRRLGIGFDPWLWRVLLPSRENGELLISVTETEQDKQPLKKAVFAPEVVKWCAGRKLDAAVDAKPNPEKLYHLTLTGKVNVTSSVKDKLPSAYVMGSFTLTDNETGEVLFDYTLGMRQQGAKGNSEETIRAIALRAGAAEVLTEMASRIVVALPARENEFVRQPK